MQQLSSVLSVCVLDFHLRQTSRKLPGTGDNHSSYGMELLVCSHPVFLIPQTKQLIPTGIHWVLVWFTPREICSPFPSLWQSLLAFQGKGHGTQGWDHTNTACTWGGQKETLQNMDTHHRDLCSTGTKNVPTHRGILGTERLQFHHQI